MLIKLPVFMHFAEGSSFGVTYIQNKPLARTLKNVVLNHAIRSGISAPDGYSQAAIIREGLKLVLKFIPTK